MSEGRKESGTYSYTKTFSAQANSKPIAEMDKEALQAYINRLLAPNSGQSNQRESNSI